MGEIANRIVEIVHAHRDSRAWEVEHFLLDSLAVFAFPDHAQLAWAGDPEIRGAILIAEGVAADDDRVGPARYQSRDIVDHDRLAEDDSSQYVSDRAVGRAPHLLQPELLHPILVRSDGRAFYTDAVLLDRFGRFDGNSVVGLVALFDSEIVIKQIDVEIGEDEPLADPLPYDPGHFVAVDLDDGILHFDLGHGGCRFLPSLKGRVAV